MHIWCIAAPIVFAAIARGQPAGPSFTADRVLSFDSAHPTPLAPGMLISIYGQDLGPERGCEGQADNRRMEPIYPTELCGVRVFVGDKAAGLLYVQEKQINFKVPQDVPLEGEAQLKVIFQERPTSLVPVPLGLENPKLPVEGIARVGSPVWIKVDLPYGWGFVVYPVSYVPADFGCHGLEVCQDGRALSRIAVATAPGIGPRPLSLGRWSTWFALAGNKP